MFFCSSAADFLFFWGVVFMVSTTLVAIFKRENEHGKGKKRVLEETKGVMETYKLLFSIIKMPTVFTFCALLLTAKVRKHYQINVWPNRAMKFCIFVMWEGDRFIKR